MFEKLNGEEVVLQLNHANLVNEVAPYQIHQLSTLVNKMITNESKKRSMPNSMAFTKVTINENEVHAILKCGAYSRVNNAYAPKITRNGSIANVGADQLTKFALIQVDDVVMLRLSYLNEDTSNMDKT